MPPISYTTPNRKETACRLTAMASRRRANGSDARNSKSILWSRESSTSATETSSCGLSRPLAGRRVAAVLASLEDSLRKHCGMPQRFLRGIPASTTTNTDVPANRGRLDAGRTLNRCATFPSNRRWKLTRTIRRRPDETNPLDK